MKPTIMPMAILLAACASPVAHQQVAPPAPLAPLPAGAPFADEIMQFAQADRANPPPRCTVLFVGSSSIRMWSTLERDMAPLPVLNRGFGGSTITDVNRYFDRIVAPYSPRAIVFYAGENDIDSGQSPEHVADQFRRFLDKKWARFGDVPVFYISAKPSKARFAQLERQSALNARIQAFAASRQDLDFIDVRPKMMSEGRPRELFVEDGLHMSPEGYAIWRDLVQGALQRRNVAQARCPD